MVQDHPARRSPFIRLYWTVTKTITGKRLYSRCSIKQLWRSRVNQRWRAAHPTDSTAAPPQRPPAEWRRAGIWLYNSVKCMIWGAERVENSSPAGSPRCVCAVKLQLYMCTLMVFEYIIRHSPRRRASSWIAEGFSPTVHASPRRRASPCIAEGFSPTARSVYWIYFSISISPTARANTGLYSQSS